jgi:hypothetical protein
VSKRAIATTRTNNRKSNKEAERLRGYRRTLFFLCPLLACKFGAPWWVGTARISHNRQPAQKIRPKVRKICALFSSQNP